MDFLIFFNPSTFQSGVIAIFPLKSVSKSAFDSVLFCFCSILQRYLLSGGDFISQTLYLDVVPMLLVPGLEEDSLGPLQPHQGLELEAELPGEAGRGQMVGPGSGGWVGPAVKTLQYHIHNPQTLIQVI